MAHTPNSQGQWHSLRDHVQAVATQSAEWAAPWGCAELARALALAHDSAKADPRFQAYLQACADGRKAESVVHADPGAAAVSDSLSIFVALISGHHSGLPDRSRLADKLAQACPQSVAAAQSFLNEIGAPTAKPDVPHWAVADAEAAEVLMRMAFSALVDADFLDTERHFLGSNARTVASLSKPIDLLASMLEEHLKRIRHGSDLTPVNELRWSVAQDCKAKAIGYRGFFRLTVPTGGGKTLSSLRFALQHARHNRQERVIVAIPYTSIIDQTEQTYAQIFGEDAVLAHHSGWDPSPDEERFAGREARQKLLSENWDCPLIVTTTVQLFESLFASRVSRCRKVHRIANSVIILDEVQTLPPELLAPIAAMLQMLVERFGCSVVFCTATQPDFSPLNLKQLSEATEIISNVPSLFAGMSRRSIANLAEPLTHTEIASMLDNQRQALCILNTRRDAVEVARACKPGSDLFHLSTLMCPAHRKQVLGEVRRRLAQDMAVRLVSTQVVEAGVDIDFPAVMRALGPLDRIIQAAGRCNREGRLAQGVCTVFRLAREAKLKGSYQAGVQLADSFLTDGQDPESPSVLQAYFRELYRSVNTDKHGIQNLRRAFEFRTVSEKMKLIEEDGASVLCFNHNPEVCKTLLSVPVEARSRSWLRRIGTHSVNLRQREVDDLVVRGLVVQEPSHSVYYGPYDELTGLGTGREIDPADLVA